MSRSTIDLIGELQTEAASGRFFTVALAVAFENTTLFVFPNEPEALESLNQMVTNGGEPIGFLATTNEGKTGKIQTKILHEYKDDLRAHAYLEELSFNFWATLKDRKFIR